METGGSVMIFRKKKETTSVKLARAAGRTAARVVRNAEKAAVVAGRVGRQTAVEVAGALSRTNQATRKAIARRKTRKKLERVRGSLKKVGAAAAAAGLTVAAAATATGLLKRRRGA
jgi:hypothetical protein